MFTPVNKFTVDRSKWGHGLNGQGGSLRKSNGCMCVLGFYGKACGLSDGELTASGGWLSAADSRVTSNHTTITRINDRKAEVGKKHGRAYKEARLIALFKRLGIKLAFKGQPKQIA